MKDVIKYSERVYNPMPKFGKIYLHNLGYKTLLIIGFEIIGREIYFLVLEKISPERGHWYYYVEANILNNYFTFIGDL